MEMYYAGLQKVFRHIDEHLAGDLSLAALSRISGYSPYHFHRVFHAMTGQTPHDYVLDRRVNAAAARLLYERCPVTDIALDCGFSSAGNLVRCFRKYFGCAPAQYRKNTARKRPTDCTNNDLKSYHQDPELDALASIVTLPDMRTVGIMVKGLSETFQSKTVEAAFQTLFSWAAASGLNLTLCKVMGITLDTPEVVPLSECRYFACVSTDTALQPQGGIVARQLPLKGDYIRFSLMRTRADFPETLFRISDYLYGSYMPRVGCYPDNRSFVEIYKQNGPEVEVEFYIPVRWPDRVYAHPDHRVADDAHGQRI